jgi:hypothetical protein
MVNYNAVSFNDQYHCKHCGEQKDKHAEDLQCLFAPTKYESITYAQYLLRIYKELTVKVNIIV